MLSAMGAYSILVRFFFLLACFGRPMYLHFVVFVQKVGRGASRNFMFAKSCCTHKHQILTVYSNNKPRTKHSPTPYPFALLPLQRGDFSLTQNTELLGDTDDALLWNPLRASSAGEILTTTNSDGVTTTATAAGAPRSLTLWPGSSHNDTSLLMSTAGAAPTSTESSRSPSPDNSVFPNFARGAAIASGSKPAAAATAPEFLLPESSCSSLPGPLVFGESGEWPAAAAAVTSDSADDEGGFWSPA